MQGTTAFQHWVIPAAFATCLVRELDVAAVIADSMVFGCARLSWTSLILCSHHAGHDWVSAVGGHSHVYFQMICQSPRSSEAAIADSAVHSRAGNFDLYF